MNMMTTQYLDKLALDLKERGLNNIAAFLLRMHLPLSGLAAHVLMGAEPFLKVFDIEVNKIYETLNDRETLNSFIDQLEQIDNEK